MPVTWVRFPSPAPTPQTPYKIRLFCNMLAGNGASYNTPLQQVQGRPTLFALVENLQSVSVPYRRLCSVRHRNPPLFCCSRYGQGACEIRALWNSGQGLGIPPCQHSGRLAKARHSPRAALWRRVWRALAVSVQLSGWRRLALPGASPPGSILCGQRVGAGCGWHPPVGLACPRCVPRKKPVGF